MISPILTYNSEVWGLFIKSDFKYWDTSPIEKGHLEFCKRYLQVNNKASNIACRAELGRYPLIFGINKRILKYISYLQSKEQSSLVTQSLVMSMDLHSNGKTSFYANLIKMLNYHNIPFNFNHDNLNDTKMFFCIFLISLQFHSFLVLTIYIFFRGPFLKPYFFMKKLPQ